jgi:hypothetical protein
MQSSLASFQAHASLAISSNQPNTSSLPFVLTVVQLTSFMQGFKVVWFRISDLHMQRAPKMVYFLSSIPILHASGDFFSMPTN